MRNILIAGNWKMNTTATEAKALAEKLSEANIGNHVEVLVCPPFVNLSIVQQTLNDTAILLGAQNVHEAEKGAYTGEVSAAMLADIGVSHVLIGHSERRQYCGETDALVNQKVKQALAHHLTPVICIGETLSEREAGTELEVVEQQVQNALKDISFEESLALVWAYEPVWAIGTGKTATPEQAQAMHAAIRTWLVAATNAEIGAETQILYGGSMNAANAAELLAQPDIDGGLIGGASLKAEDFKAIISAATASI